VDNKFAISLCKNLMYHECSKHIDVCYHFIWECVKEGKVAADYTSTVEQLVDTDEAAQASSIPGAARQNWHGQVPVEQQRLVGDC
jgi:hypothetical protein